MAKIRFKDILDKYESIRALSREINEDPSDISRWRDGVRRISPRAVISICRLHPDVLPNDLSEIFPADLTFNFGDE